MMIKSPLPTLHKTTRPEITPLFGSAKLVLDETPKAITPFGGLASFISFLGQIGFTGQVQQHLPFAKPTSNNAIPLAHSLTAFLMSVVVGARTLPYVIVARLTSTLKRRCAGIGDWTMIDEHYAAGEFTAQLFGWSKERRFVVVRERVRETKAAVGRRLLDVPGYTFRLWVTNRQDSALALWRDYNQRACIEQRIEELKHDLAADGFCLQPFLATESAFLAVLFTFNLLSLYQHQTTPASPYRQPGTLRTTVFLCGAILGVMGRDAVLKLSAAWGGLAKHNPLGPPRWTGSTTLRRSWFPRLTDSPSEEG